jgi:hypothetical protein
MRRRKVDGKSRGAPAPSHHFGHDAASGRQTAPAIPCDREQQTSAEVHIPAVISAAQTGHAAEQLLPEQAIPLGQTGQLAEVQASSGGGASTASVAASPVP